MVRLNKIYTKTGDDGTTGLGTGERRPKFDLRVAAYGAVDETNATIGMVRLQTGSDAGLAAIDAMLVRTQNDLFDLGADLCMPDTDEDPGHDPLRIVDSQVEWLEAQIDALNTDLQPLKSFILPGGHPASAHLHLARTVCRRAERLTAELASRPDEPVGAPVLHYLNRLSDFLFVAGRWVNNKGEDDILWVPGANR